MATGSTIPGSRNEQRGLSYWMERVLKELETVRSAPDPDAVHDLRVALRRCRALAAVMEEIDPHPAWPEMRKLGRKIFRQFGELRDTQVLEDWAEKLSETTDPVKVRLLESLKRKEVEEREAALRAVAKFDAKAWKKLERTLNRRQRIVPLNGLAAESLALERMEAAKELHNHALRTEKPEPWHELRIGVKRFRYTVESLLPVKYEAWGRHLKQVQDVLGDLHDLDVLAEKIANVAPEESAEAHEVWISKIAQERQARLDEYRELAMGQGSVWQEWKEGLPQGKRLEGASLARLRATAKSLDKNPARTAVVARIALRLFDGFARTKAGVPFSDRSLKKILQAAARLHAIGSGMSATSPHKAARKYLRHMTIPLGWSESEWDLLGLVVRYHRGDEPKGKHKAYARLSEDEQLAVCALAGVLRLARELRKSGAATIKGLQMDRSVDAVILRVPGLQDNAETAARIAAGKHLLESTLELPLLVQPVPPPPKLVELPKQPETIHPTAAASD